MCRLARLASVTHMTRKIPALYIWAFILPASCFLINVLLIAIRLLKKVLADKYQTIKQLHDRTIHCHMIALYVLGASLRRVFALSHACKDATNEPNDWLWLTKWFINTFHKAVWRSQRFSYDRYDRSELRSASYVDPTVVEGDSTIAVIG